MSRRLEKFVWDMLRSLAETNGEDGGDGGGGHSEFGVHITYQDLYGTVLFLTAIYVSGEIARRVLRMPSLVGEIFAGILLGPPLLDDFVPNPEAWVMFGELGCVSIDQPVLTCHNVSFLTHLAHLASLLFSLVLLVIEAGIDIDLSTLKLIGTRGFLIAFFGSVLPIGIGMLITYWLDITDTKGILAAGAVFGPTSLGIALNILRNGGVLNT